MGKQESESAAPGEKPRFLGVREQRVTGLCIFLLIGSSIFMTDFLTYVPMPVLYGVFLYMGLSSLNGVQLVDRLKLLLMPGKHQPDYTEFLNTFLMVFQNLLFKIFLKL